MPSQTDPCNPGVDAIKVSIGGGVDTERVVHVHDGVLLASQKGVDLVPSSRVNEPEEHCVASDRPGISE